MITTLPGLYLVSVGAVKPAAWLLGWTGSVVCSVGMLRFVNLLFSAGNLYLLYLLLSKIHQKNKVRSQRIILCTHTSRFGGCVYIHCICGLSSGLYSCKYYYQFGQGGKFPFL